MTFDELLKEYNKALEIIAKQRETLERIREEAQKLEAHIKILQDKLAGACV